MSRAGMRRLSKLPLGLWLLQLLLPSYSVSSSLSAAFFDTYAQTHHLLFSAFLPPTRLFCRRRSFCSRATLSRYRLPLSSIPSLPEDAEPLGLFFIFQYELIGVLAGIVCSGKQRIAAARKGCLAHPWRQGSKGD